MGRGLRKGGRGEDEQLGLALASRGPRAPWCAVSLGIVLFVPSLLLYCRTMQPSVGDFGDSAKFQLVACVLGIPHTTGYPLYVSLARLFTFLPLRDVAYRVTLLSAVSAASAVALVGVSVWMLTHSLAAAGSAALLFAGTRTFWSQAIIAEVYTLNALLFLLVMMLMFLWRRRREGRLYAVALAVYALGLGNHATILLLFPALVWFVGMTDRRMLSRPRVLGLAAAILALGACQYLLLFLRARQHPFFCEACPDTLPRLWSYLTGAQFRSQLFAFPLGELARRVLDYRRLLLTEYGAVPLAMGIAGIAALGVTRRHEMGLLALVFVADVFFAMSYDIGDFVNYLIPSYMVFAIWIGGGVAAVERGIAILGGRLRCVACQRVAPGVWALVAIGVAFWLLRANYPVMDESSDYAAREEATAILELVAEDAVLLFPPCCDFYDRAMAVLYLQQVEGVRPDVTLGEFNAGDPGRAFPPSVLPQQERVPVSLIGDGSEPAIYFPRLAPDLRAAMEEYYVLEPVDSSTTRLPALLNGLPAGSVVIIASRHPGSYAVDNGTAGEDVEVAMRGLGFRGMGWPGEGAHVLIGVRGAEPGTAVEVRDTLLVQFSLAAGDAIGATGVKAPVPLRVLASTADTDIVIDGTNRSPHHRDYNLVVLQPETGRVLLAAHFDTETFLVDNVRVYRIAAVR